MDGSEAASMETFEQRLNRYTTQNDLEIFGWLAVYLQNAYLPELRGARNARLYHCLYLITHSVMQMISEHLFGLKGREGTRFYLENFVDGSSPDKRFSLVANEIHDVRNVMAHLGYSSLQHRVEYFNNEIAEGWKREGGTVHINPDIYAQHFEEAIIRHAYISKYQQQSERTRIIRKYRFIRQWLKLDKTNPIAKEMNKLEACRDLNDMRLQETIVQQTICRTYNLLT
jgi:hypothetical protein